jgi:hypothetical protein
MSAAGLQQTKELCKSIMKKRLLKKEQSGFVKNVSPS